VLPTQLAGTHEQPMVLSLEQHQARVRQLIREAFAPLTIEHRAKGEDAS
jgi:hypothetical protein